MKIFSFIKNRLWINNKPYFEMGGHKFSLPFEGETNQAIKEIINDYLLHGKRLWEPETTKIVKALVKEGDTCVDVGASIGYFTLLFARQVGEKGKVYSFEPTSNQFKYLEKNIYLNYYIPRVMPYNLAAWDKEEDNFVRRDIIMNEKAFEKLGKPVKIQINAGNNEPIIGVKLDDILPEKVDFIKMDVDGSEPRALKGLIKTIERNSQLKMVIEYYPDCIRKLGNNPQDMMDILNKYFNYTKIPRDYGGDYYNLYCERK